MISSLVVGGESDIPFHERTRVIERVVVGARVGEGAGCSDDRDVCMYEESLRLQTWRCEVGEIVAD